ncbi:hypothetical protein ACJJTC_015075 [Scirpophaga incertulas]
MSSQAKKCAGCRSIITTRQFLRCSACTKYYDLMCANVSENRYNFNAHPGERRLAWQCQTCMCKKPTSDNTNTPVRSEDSGVNLRRGAAAVTSPDELPSNPRSGDLALADEMRQFREELRAMRLQFHAQNSTLATLLGRIDSQESRLDLLTARIDSMELLIAQTPTVSTSEASLVSTIERLKSELNDREQEALLNDVEISCIPEGKSENLSHILVNIGHKLGIQLQQNYVVSVSRVGRLLDDTDGKSRPRPIVVRFVRRAVRDQLLKEARVRRGATTEGLDLPEPSRRFYVNERLTRFNRLLFRQARNAGDLHKWRYIWKRDGRIYARENSGSSFPRIRLRMATDIERVIGKIPDESPANKTTCSQLE